MGSESSREKRLANLRPFRPGQAGNPRGSNPRQRLQSQLKKLEKPLFGALLRILEMPPNPLTLEAAELLISLQWPNEWREAQAQNINTNTTSQTLIQTTASPEERARRAAIVEHLMKRLPEGQDGEADAVNAATAAEAGNQTKQ